MNSRLPFLVSDHANLYGKSEGLRICNIWSVRYGPLAVVMILQNSCIHILRHIMGTEIEYKVHRAAGSGNKFARTQQPGGWSFIN